MSYASLADNWVKRWVKRMGHPKALTPYSIDCLEQFLGRHPEINLAGYSDYEAVRSHEHLA